MRNRNPVTKEHEAAPSRARFEPAEPAERAAPGEDTDETIDTRAGALPRAGVPADVPDTQEALYAEDGAYRADEDEGEGRRLIDPMELTIQADGLSIISEQEL